LTRLWVDFIRKKPSLARGYEGESRQQHHDLLRAAKSRDLAAAEAVLTLHINHARDLLVSHLRQVDVDRAPERTVPMPAATTSRPSQRRVRGG
jgi:DNA-binding GntR family transcriptional regulator